MIGAGTWLTFAIPYLGRYVQLGLAGMGDRGSRASGDTEVGKYRYM